MTNEDLLYDTLTAVLPTYHLVMDGEPECAAVYRENAPGILYESGEPILYEDRYDIEIYQQQHDPGTITEAIQALTAAGFFARVSGAQASVPLTTETGYAIDRLSASRTRETE